MITDGPRLGPKSAKSAAQSQASRQKLKRKRKTSLELELIFPNQVITPKSKKEDKESGSKCAPNSKESAPKSTTKSKEKLKRKRKASLELELLFPNEPKRKKSN